MAPSVLGIPVSRTTRFDGHVAPQSEQFDTLLQKAWQGEWYGVRVYGELAAARKDPVQTATLLELVVLETYVLGELTVALLGLGIEPELGGIEAEADVDLEAHRDDEWMSLISWLKSDAEVALGHYLPMPGLVVDDVTLSRLAVLVVEHEKALISFAERTLASDPKALADVRALVRVDS